jgi:hypothetical protein
MIKRNVTRRAAALLGPLALIAALVLAPAGCRRQRVKVQETEEEAPRLASMIHMADPRAGSQLLSGFHDIEQNAWRWTERRFSVALRPPAGSAQNGGVLNLKFTIPEVTITKLQEITLAASVNGSPLPPETYKKAGDYTYTREVPPHVLTGESVRVDFTLDKALAPGEADGRELGVVVLNARLEPK